MKKKLPTRATLIAKLDKIFSQYIRKRDSNGGDYFRCISCGEIKTINKADCGHFFSRRRFSVRWNEDNCHAECSSCNRFDGEHLLRYKENLIKKIGQERFDLLEFRANQPVKYTDFELDELFKHYTQLYKLLDREQKAAEKNFNRLRRKKVL